MCYGPIYILTIPNPLFHVCVVSRCMFSVDVREAGWFFAHGMITQIQKQLLSDGSVKIDGSTN